MKSEPRRPRREHGRARPLALVLLILAVVVVLAAGAAAWLLGTTAGLHFALDRAASFTGGKLAVDRPQGSIAGTMTFDRIAYAADGTSVEAHGIRVRVDGGDLLHGTVRVDPLHVDRLVLHLAPAEENLPAQPPPGLPASLALPVAVDVPQFTVGELEIDRAGAPLVSLRDIAVAYRGGSARHDLLALRAVAPATRIEARGSLDAAQPYAIALQAAVTRSADAPPAALAGTLQLALAGDLREIQATADASGDTVRAHVDAQLAPLTQPWPTLLKSARLRADAIDLAAFSPALPATRVDVLASVHGTNDGHLAGTLEAVNALAAPLDEKRLPVASVRARFESDLATATLSDLAIDLAPGGAVNGSGRLQREPLAARFDVRARALDLRALGATLRATALDGRLEIDVLGPQRQIIAGTLAQKGIEVRARAERDGAQVTLSEARLAVFGGEVSGSGRLALDAAQPFTATLRFAGFDPARLGDYPQGSLNGRATVQGALAAPRRIDAEWTVADSTLRGQPLRSRGSAQVAGTRVARVDATASLGRNRAAVQGAFGAATDRLQWQVDAPALAQLGAGLGGRFEGRGTFAGTLADAAITVHGSGRALRLPAGISVGDLRIDGTVGRSADAPLDLTLRARSLALSGNAIDDVTITARGVTGRHTASLQVRAAADTLDARLAGGWHPARNEATGAWKGTLQALDLRATRKTPAVTTHTGAATGSATTPPPEPVVVHLAQPAALSVAPAQVQVDDAVFEVADGRAQIERLAWQAGRLETRGRIDGVSTRLLLALAATPPELQTTVRLDGAWSVQMQPRLNGTLNLRRASGDVRVAGERAIEAGLTEAGLEAKFTDGRVDAQLVVRAAIASIEAHATVTPAPGAPGPGYTAQSSFDLSARLDVARIDGITAPLLTVARVAGSAAATLRGSGSLGTPRFDGQVRADGIGVDVPPYGIALHDGIVRAQLQGDTLQLERAEIRGGDGRFTAQGSLPLRKGGRSTALDWRAENFGLLDRPDMRLVLSGEGQAGFGADKFALRGRLHADRGYFETPQRRLPSPGEDVVLVGQKAPEEEAGAAGLPLDLDLRLELGNDLRVRALGLSGKVTGALQLTTTDAGELRAKGRIETKDATYRAYGQELQVDPGVAIFDGPVRNPTLDITAWRRNQAVEAGVQISGTVQTPRVTLVSDPVVPQGERLSWLVLGRAPGDAQGADLALLQAAAGAVLGRGDSVPLTQQIAGALGFDELAIRGSKEIASNVVALGKRLSDKFYVTYEHGLGAAAESLVKLDYLLTRRLSLRAETGSTSGFGILYRFSWD